MNDEQCPDLPDLMTPALRAQLRSFNEARTKFTREAVWINQTIRDAVERQVQQLQVSAVIVRHARESVERQMPRIEANMALLHEALEREKPRIAEAVRVLASTIEANRPATVTGTATVNLGGLQAIAVGNVESPVNTLAAAAERSTDAQAFVADLLRAGTRAHLGLAQHDWKRTGLAFFHLIALVGSVLTILGYFGIEPGAAEPSPDVEAPASDSDGVELSEPARGEIERYVAELLRAALEQDEDPTTSPAGAPPADAPETTP